MAATLLALAFAGCGGAGVYPDTDVVEPKGKPTGFGEVKKQGGLMQAGNLEYETSGELVPTFRDYIAAMREHGWSSVKEEVAGGRATATLQKDTRNCSVVFVSDKGAIKAAIKVGPAGGK
jgi:hypothetical protein